MYVLASLTERKPVTSTHVAFALFRPWVIAALLWTEGRCDGILENEIDVRGSGCLVLYVDRDVVIFQSWPFFFFLFVLAQFC